MPHSKTRDVPIGDLRRHNQVILDSNADQQAKKHTNDVDLSFEQRKGVSHSRTWRDPIPGGFGKRLNTYIL